MVDPFYYHYRWLVNTSCQSIYQKIEDDERNLLSIESLLFAFFIISFFSLSQHNFFRIKRKSSAHTTVNSKFMFYHWASCSHLTRTLVRWNYSNGECTFNFLYCTFNWFQKWTQANPLYLHKINFQGNGGQAFFSGRSSFRWRYQSRWTWDRSALSTVIFPVRLSHNESLLFFLTHPLFP